MTDIIIRLNKEDNQLVVLTECQYPAFRDLWEGFALIDGRTARFLPHFPEDVKVLLRVEEYAGFRPEFTGAKYFQAEELPAIVGRINLSTIEGRHSARSLVNSLGSDIKIDEPEEKTVSKKPYWAERGFASEEEYWDWYSEQE